MCLMGGQSFDFPGGQREQIYVKTAPAVPRSGAVRSERQQAAAGQRGVFVGGRVIGEINLA